MNVVGADVAATAECQAVAGRPFIHVRSVERMIEPAGRAGDEGAGQKRWTGLGAAGGVEPVENALDDLVGRNELADRRSRRIDHRSFVVPVVRGIPPGGSGVVGRSLIDLGYVAAVADAEPMAPIALWIEISRQPRAHGAVVDSLVSGLIVSRCFVVAAANAEAPLLIEIPLVIDEERSDREVGWLRKRRHRVVFDLARAGIGATVNVGRRQLRRCGRRASYSDSAFVAQDDAVDAEIASRLEIVLVAELMKFVIAADDAVVPDRARAEEVRALGQVLLVVPLFGRARRTAEGCRPHPVSRRW